MALQANSPQLRVGDMIYTVKQKIVTEIKRLLKPYAQTAVEVMEAAEVVTEDKSAPPMIYFCPVCKQFFLTPQELVGHIVPDAEEEGVFIHETTGYPGQKKALKAFFAGDDGGN